MKLSALVCAHNDEARLADCLRGLEFCDEIVVVADRCTDRTQEIARQFDARVIDGIFPLENHRKAAGVAACLGEWILEIEPDQTIDATLAYEVRAAIHGRPQGDWFDIPVRRHLGDALVRRGWSSGSAEPRLFRRQVKHWNARRIDAFAQMEGRYAGALESPLIQRTDGDVGQMMSQLDQQTWLRAQDIADAGAPGRLSAAVWRGMRRFSRCYVLRQGAREGAAGFLIALMAGLDPILSTLRAREIVAARAQALVIPANAPASTPARLGRTG